LAVGQRLHVHPIRLEGGAGSRRQRDGRQLHASEAPATPSEERSNAGLPMVVVVVHFGLLGGVILFVHHPIAFLGRFLMFLGFT